MRRRRAPATGPEAGPGHGCVKTELSNDEARRIALAAQGFADSRPGGRVDARHLRRVVDRTGVIQIDSVNVLARAHYLPFFSRLGPYTAQAVDDLAYRRREWFEYWAHAACLVPVEREPLFRHRMVEWPERYRLPGSLPVGYLNRVVEEISERGPLGVSDLEDRGERGSGAWWGWGAAKRALEHLFMNGTLTTAGRRNFERLYDLRERVLPPEVLAQPTPDRDDAHRELVRLAARSHGVGTVKDLADYYRLPVAATKGRLEELADAGEVRRVGVEGWAAAAYVHRDARLPRRMEARALLAPFDPLVWERDRTERLFDFFYRIEIYTPAPQRVYGYYVLPFLLGDRLVARVDLKADRQAGLLRVPGAYLESGTAETEVAGALAEDLASMAGWLGLAGVQVGNRGNLSRALRRAVAAHPVSFPA